MGLNPLQGCILGWKVWRFEWQLEALRAKSFVSRLRTAPLAGSFRGLRHRPKDGGGGGSQGSSLAAPLLDGAGEEGEEGHGIRSTHQDAGYIGVRDDGQTADRDGRDGRDGGDRGDGGISHTPVGSTRIHEVDVESADGRTAFGAPVQRVTTGIVPATAAATTAETVQTVAAPAAATALVQAAAAAAVVESDSPLTVGVSEAPTPAAGTGAPNSPRAGPAAAGGMEGGGGGIPWLGMPGR